MKTKVSKISLIIICILTFASVQSFAQGISIAGNIGFASPNGGSFVDAAGEKMAGGGLALDADILYHLPQLDNKLGVGITYNTSLLLGVSTGDAFEVGLYEMSLYGVKAHYSFFTNSITPFVSLGTGLSQFGIPEIKDASGTVWQEAKSSNSFGLRPEVGLNLGGFAFSVSYFVPMKYEVTEKTAGNMQFSLGYRFKTF
jgi:hypothetical protein